MSKPIGVTPVDLFGAAMDASLLSVLDHSGFDPIRNPAFWETWLAIQLGGATTRHKAEVDLRVRIWGRNCTAEVKFSTAFHCRFTPINGRDWSRNMFKWVLTRPQEKRRDADAIIMIGVDVDRSIYSWVVPYSHIPSGRRSISVTAPSSRGERSPGRIDSFYSPVTELLPAFARAAHKIAQPDLLLREDPKP